MDTQINFRSKRIYRFVEEYVKDRNGTQAAIRAGYSPSCADVTASRLLADDRIRLLIEAEMARVTREARIEAADVLREYLDLATADPSKIMQLRRLNCRYCYGLEYHYQWQTREFAEACDAEARRAVKEKRPEELPDCFGGFGFIHNREPNPDCPDCAGEGVEDVYICDTEMLTGPERKLILGVKKTRDGVEIKLRDQDAALRILAQYAGLLVERKELTGKDGQPLLPTAPLDALPTDPRQLAEIYSQIVGA